MKKANDEDAENTSDVETRSGVRTRDEDTSEEAATRLHHEENSDGVVGEADLPSGDWPTAELGVGDNKGAGVEKDEDK